MVAAFLLGVTGSLGHCVGMCSGVSLLLSRKANASGWQLLLLHSGRITTYALLGGVVGTLGILLNAPWCQNDSHDHNWMGGPSIVITLQGLLALLTAAIAIYMAVALIGRAPSPEIYLRGFTRWWGKAMRRIKTSSEGGSSSRNSQKNPIVALLTIYGLGMLWGFLPCGLVLAALLVAMASASPAMGALTMVAFGLGTSPMIAGIGVAVWRQGRSWRLLPQLRLLAAVVVLAFGLQMALRGLAVWGVVRHLHLGGLMLW